MSEQTQDARERITQAEALVAELDRFASAFAASLENAYGPRAVSAEFDRRGVLRAISIDPEVRAQLTAAQFVEQLKVAITTGPPIRLTAPEEDLTTDFATRAEAVLAWAEAERVRVHDLTRAEPVAPPTVEHHSPDGRVTLIAAHGKPVDVRFDASWIVSEPGDSLAASLVDLARAAAYDSGGGA